MSTKKLILVIILIALGSVLTGHSWYQAYHRCDDAGPSCR